MLENASLPVPFSTQTAQSLSLIISAQNPQLSDRSAYPKIVGIILEPVEPRIGGASLDNAVVFGRAGDVFVLGEAVGPVCCG